MQIVIDIPEEMYQKIKETSMVISGRRSGRTIDYTLFNAVNKGTPLPKGHGNLVDISELMDMLCLEDNAYNRDNNVAELITLEDMDRLDVIIPADKEE